MPTKIQLRRGTSTDWTSVNPLLAVGEVGIETDTKQFKIGDGVTYWTSLEYASITQDALDLKYDASNPDGYVNAAGASAAAPVQSVAGKVGTVTLTKSDVGLSNVDNVSAANLRDRSTHTGTQLAATISDFASASQSAIIVQTISNNDTTHVPSSDAVHDALATEEAARISIDNRVTDIENDYGVANGLATLDSAGKISTSMLPGTVLEYKGTWDASTNTPTLQNGSGANLAADAGHIYRVSVAGTVDFGAGNITFFVGDDVVLSESLEWQRSPGGSLVISVNGFQGDVILDSEDIALTTSVAAASDVQHALENVYASVSSTMTDHTEALDPHPQYETSSEAQAKIDAHANLTNNPHSVTKTQVGLSNVDNTSDLNKPISTATQSALDLKANSSDVYTKTQSDSNYEPKSANIQTHISDTSNPHSVTKAQVGLGSVDNVSAANLRDRSTHTGTQLASTISDFTTAVQGVTIGAAQIDGGNVSNTEFSYLDGVTSAIQTQLDGKQPTGAYITALTGDVTASGPGSATATLSDSGVAPGTYDEVWVDAKGRVTYGIVTRLQYVTSAQTTNSTVTYAAVAGMTTASLAPGLYRFTFNGQYQSASTNTGVGFRISTGTATVTTCAAKWFLSQAVDGTAKNFQYDQLNSTTNVTSASTLANNTNANIMGQGVFRVTSTGTMQIQIRSETAASQVLVQPDAVMTIELIV